MTGWHNQILYGILKELLGVSLPAVGSGFTLVVLKMKKPFLKATAAIPNASRFALSKNSGESSPFFVILTSLFYRK
jgi:hypothetical protein